MQNAIVPRCQFGDLWQLGKHFILCGDSTNLHTLHRLLGSVDVNMVFADPPYGINVVSRSGHVGKGSKIYSKVIGDTDTATAIAGYLLCAGLFAKATHIWWGANYYADILPPSRCWVVWDKQISAKSFADAELAWSNHKSSVRIFQHQWNGACKASERGQPRYHPTQKPVKLAEYCYERYGQPGDAIFDPFLGSGISVLAAEHTNRRCYGIEISPAYCDVTIARYEQATGETAHLIERIADSSVA
jgi:DNA modification methylase